MIVFVPIIIQYLLPLTLILFLLRVVIIMKLNTISIGVSTFNNISIPDGIKCVDPNCVNESHANDVNDFYCNIIRILTECGSHLVSNVKGNNTQSQYNAPGWSDHVDSFHDAARERSSYGN